MNSSVLYVEISLKSAKSLYLLTTIYQNTPSVEDLGNLVAVIQASGADIVKIATTGLDITDVARRFSDYCSFSSKQCLVSSFSVDFPPCYLTTKLRWFF